MVEEYIEGDLPPVDSDTLKKDRISLEEAIALQLQEEQPPDAGQPIEEPVQEEEVITEAPVETDTPTEVSDPSTTTEVDEYLFEVDGYKVRDVDEAKNGWMMQKDYTKKTQDLSAERKRVDELRQAAADNNERYLAGLQRTKQLDEVLYQEPDWAALQEQNPEGYIHARHSWDQIQQRRKQMDAEIQATQEEQKQYMQERIQNHVTSENERLLEKVPEWREEAAAKEFLTGVTEYLTEYEFTPEEINNISDHRLILILKDAIQGRSVSNKGSAPLVQKKVAKARKGLSGAPRQAPPDPNATRIQQARENLSRDGGLEDAIELQLAEAGLPYDDGIR